MIWWSAIEAGVCGVWGGKYGENPDGVDRL